MVKNFPTAHINLNEKLKTHSIISERFPLKKNWFLFFLYILINAGIYVVEISEICRTINIKTILQATSHCSMLNLQLPLCTILCQKKCSQRISRSSVIFEKIEAVKREAVKHLDFASQCLETVKAIGKKYTDDSMY